VRATKNSAAAHARSRRPELARRGVHTHAAAPLTSTITCEEEGRPGQLGRGESEDFQGLTLGRR
jgi:hypothetical protein